MSDTHLHPQLLQLFYFLNFLIVGPIGSPLSKHRFVSASISNLSSQSFKHSSAFSGGMATTPSASPRIISPGLTLTTTFPWPSLPLNSSISYSTGTFNSEDLVKPFDPKTLTPLANRPMPISRCSLISRNRPSITTPEAPRYLARVVIRPPQQALITPLGCEMKTTLPEGMESAKWPGGVGDVLSDAWTMRTVYAGPNILLEPDMYSGEYILRPERYPPWGTLRRRRASPT